MNAGNIMMVSLQQGDTPEQAAIRALRGPGFYYLAILGSNGAFDPDTPYQMTLDVAPPAPSDDCQRDLAPASGAFSAPFTATNVITTLIVTHFDRWEQFYGFDAAQQVHSKTVELAQAVGGLVMPVESSADAAAAFAAWDINTCSARTANDAAFAIKGVIFDALRNHPTIRYIVIVGDDNIVPFYRLIDTTSVANEATYDPHASGESPTGNALRQGFILTQDYYAAMHGELGLGRLTFIPDYAIGRLVESPEEVSAAIDAFLSAPAINATHALVAGYDFLSDMSQSISATWSVTQGVPVDALINDTWTANDLRGYLFGPAAPYSLSSINAHFNQRSAAPAVVTDTVDLFRSFEIPASGLDFTGAFVQTVGCHSGLNVPDADAESDPTSSYPDWGLDFAQTWQGQGAAYLANTGYGYGTDEGLAFSEQLHAFFVQELADAPLGSALALAKQRYRNSAGGSGYGDYDIKVLAEATLYGLPMQRVNQPASAMQVGLRNAPGQVTAAAAVSAMWVQTHTFTLAPQAVDTPIGRYYHIAGEAAAPAGRPTQPRTGRVLSAPAACTDCLAHGVLFVGGAYSLESDFDPVIARPVSETALAEPAYPFAAWYPSTLGAVNRLVLGSALSERLVVYAGQFYSSAQVERLYTDQTYQVLWSDSDDLAPPQIFTSTVTPAPGGRWILRARVQDGRSGVNRVVVAYTEGDGTWNPVSLSRIGNTDTWAGQITASSRRIEVVFQAADNAGNVSSAADKGAMYFTGILVFPTAQEQTGAPGQTITYTVHVTNVSSISHTYSVTIAGNQWPALAPLSIGPLDDGASTSMQVNVQIPAGAPDGAIDTATLIISTQEQAPKSNHVTLTTHARRTSRQVYMPIVLKNY